MTQTNRAALLSMAVLSLAAAACKGSQPGAPPPNATGSPTAQPAGAAGNDAGTDDPDIAVITITAIDIDTKLAVMCGIAESDVFFKFDSAKLVPAAKERLDKIATCAKTGPAKGKDLLIVGRTDPVGSDQYNKQLGMSRADSVAKYLQEQGVKQARTETESKGEATAANNPWRWPLERRVTLRLQQ